MLMYGRKHQTGLNWITAIAMIGFHIGAVAALFFIDDGAMLAALILYFVGGMLGIGMALSPPPDAPRLQDVQVGRVLPDLLRHARARRRSDLLGGHASHPSSEVRSGRRPAHAARRHLVGAHGMDPDGRGAAPRRLGAVEVRARTSAAIASTCWLSNWHWVSNVVVGLGLLAFGGIPYVLWGIFFRTTFGLHATWLVNSATHIWGSRRFKTRDDSTNNWWVALLTFGEGWHNNHHAHPTSARHGLAWYELDQNWIGISTLQLLGLAWDIKLAKIRQPSMSEDDVGAGG